MTTAAMMPPAERATRRAIAYGASRVVLLTRRYAIKLPRPTCWPSLLTGLLGNMQERRLARRRDPRLCPVLFSIAGGWLVVMPRARPLTASQWRRFDAAQFCAGDLPVERKRDSFGIIAGRVVAVDYGSWGST